jgi:thiol-disulfide isomerase/thioredoxin
MKKRILWVLIPFILGCNYLFPKVDQPPVAIPTQGGEIPTQVMESAPQVESSPTPPAESSPEAESASAFTIARIHKTDGDLYSLLAAETQKAKLLNQTPFLEFDATWCPPCIAINESLDVQDQITLNAFAGTYIIRADVDEWGWGDKNKFKFDGIPVYYKLDESGNPTGAVVDGDAWGDNIPGNFAPVLDEFFHSQ